MGSRAAACYGREMRKLHLSKPPKSDRIIGFTIPKGGSFYICDHDEVWKVSIGKTLRIEVTDYSPYEFVARSTDFLGLVFKGLTANVPLLRVGGKEVSYHFDPKSDFATVNYKVNGRSAQIEFQTLSGDWFAASLSDDGSHLVLAEPYDIALYELG
jgi:hypothetical protein